MSYEFLKSIKTVAVVGISANPERSSYGVAEYLMRHFTVVPINPALKEWNGLPAYPNLTEASRDHVIELVDVFRRPSEIGGVVDECIQLRIPYLWLQLGVVDEQEKARAERAGITVVMDECLAVVDRMGRWEPK